MMAPQVSERSKDLIDGLTLPKDAPSSRPEVIVQKVLLEQPASRIASLVKTQTPEDDSFFHIDTTLFDQALGYLPEGCDKSKYRYRWEPLDHGLIARFLEGSFFPGVRFRAVSREDHPDIPQRWFNSDGLVVDHTTGLMLLYCAEVVMCQFERRRFAERHQGFDAPSEEQIKSLPVYNDNKPLAHGMLMGTQTASDPAIAKSGR